MRGEGNRRSNGDGFGGPRVRVTGAGHDDQGAVFYLAVESETGAERRVSVEPTGTIRLA